MGAKLGTAPVLAAWLDYCCPFSAKAFKTITEEVVPAYGDKLTFVMYHCPQPWHPQGTLLHEAAFAVARVSGEETFWKFSTALMAEQVRFFDINTIDKSRSQIYAELVELAGTVGADTAAMAPLLTINTDGGAKNGGSFVLQDIKFHVKLARQNGIHVTPTTMLNGMVCDTSSGWSLEEWKAFLDSHLA